MWRDPAHWPGELRLTANGLASLWPMDIVLIPGLWLDASSWDEVIPSLRQAGHRTHPLTLPGMESKDADRSKITLRDHVDVVVEVIDSLDATDGQLALVGHSGVAPSPMLRSMRGLIASPVWCTSTAFRLVTVR